MPELPLVLLVAAAGMLLPLLLVRRRAVPVIWVEERHARHGLEYLATCTRHGVLPGQLLGSKREAMNAVWIHNAEHTARIRFKQVSG